MKKLAKILVLVLSVALLVGALLIVASANETKAEPDYLTWTEEKVLAVYYTGSADKYAADKADGVFDQCDASYNTYAEAVDDAANHCATGKPAYIVLTKNFNVGASEMNLTGTAEAPLKSDSTVNVTGSVITIDLNGYDLNLLLNSYVKTGATAVTDLTTQRMKGNGATDLKFIGNGGTIRVGGNLFQFNGGGGNVTFDGGDGGLNIVAAVGYAYDYNTGSLIPHDTSKYAVAEKSSNFPGSEGIVKGWNGNYAKTSASNVNILGDVTFTRENKTCVSFVCMYHTVGGFNINIGKADADATKRDTATFTVVEGSSASYGYRTFVHRDDQKKENNQDVLLSYSLKSTINVNNATIKVADSKFVDVYAQNFANATADDYITYNVKNSTLDFTGAKGAARNGFNLAGNGKVPYRITVDSSEIYDDTTCFNGGDSTGNALIQIKNCYVSVVSKDGVPTTFSQKVGTLIAENSWFNVGYFTNKGIYWKDYNKEDTTTAWPEYASTVGGYGVIVKDGNYFTNTADKGNNSTAKKSPGVYTDAGSGSNRLGNNGNGKWIQVFENKHGAFFWNMVGDTLSAPAISGATGGYLTFNGTVGTEAKDQTATNTLTFAGHTLVLGTGTNAKSRVGKYTVKANSVTGDTNTYVSHTYYQDASKSYSTSQPYFYFSTNSMSATSEATYKINDYAYYTIDHDLMTTKECFTDAFNVQFFFRSYVDGTSYQSGAYIILNEDGTWTSPSGTETYKMDYVPGEWKHITYVLEMPLKADGSVDYVNMYDDAKIHLYIDGSYKQTFTKVMPADSGNGTSFEVVKYKDGGKHAGVSEVRVSYVGGNQVGRDGAETAIDNLYFARYAKGNDFTADQLGKLYQSYDIDYPEDIPFASYKIAGETKYAAQSDLPTYIMYAMYGQPYAEYQLHTDYKGVLDLDEFAKANGLPDFDTFVTMAGGTFKVDIKTNGNKLTIADHNYVEEYDAKTQTLTLRSPTDADMITITFDDLDPATVDATIKVLPGKTVKADQFPAYETVVKESDYAKLYFNGWTKTLGEAPLAEIKVEDKDITLVPGVKIVSTLGDILFNVSANDNTALNYYVPVEWYLDATGEEDLIPGFKIVAIQNQRENAKISEFKVMAPTNYTQYDYNGKEYYCFTSYPEIANIDKTLSFIITYEFVYEGVTFTASATYVTSALDYCERVFAGNFTAAEKEIAANYLRFAYEYVNALTVLNPKNEAYKASLARIEAVYTDAAKAYCTKYETDILADKGDKDLDDLSDYIAEGGFAINGTRFNLQLSFKAGSKVKGVQLTTYGIAADRNKPLGGGKYEAAYNTIAVGSHSSQNKVENGYYTYYNTANLVPYNMFETITIVLTIDDGTETGKQVVGTYSLAAYYNDLLTLEGDKKLSDEAIAAYANVFYATKELGDSVLAYRFEEVK